MKRRSFTQESKRQAALLLLNEGIPGQMVSKKLQEYEKHGERAFPGKGSHEFGRSNEMKRLKKRIND